MEEDVLQVVDVNVNMDIKGKDVSCQERWVQTTMWMILWTKQTQV